MAAWLDRLTAPKRRPFKSAEVLIHQLISGENVLGPVILEYLIAADAAVSGDFDILSGSDTEGSSNPFITFSAVTPPKKIISLDSLISLLPLGWLLNNRTHWSTRQPCRPFTPCLPARSGRDSSVTLSFRVPKTRSR